MNPSSTSIPPISSQPKLIQFRIPFRLGVFLMAALILLMGTVSLIQLNAMSTQGYLIKELEDHNQQLVEDFEINSMLILKARSLGSIQESELVQTMVKPQQVYFLDSLTGLAENPS